MSKANDKALLQKVIKEQSALAMVLHQLGSNHERYDAYGFDSSPLLELLNDQCDEIAMLASTLYQGDIGEAPMLSAVSTSSC